MAAQRNTDGREKEGVTRAATRALHRHRRKFNTLMLDNGTEFYDHVALEESFPIKIYRATDITLGNAASMRIRLVCYANPCRKALA